MVGDAIASGLMLPAHLILQSAGRNTLRYCALLATLTARARGSKTR
jgi:hypothetical protein